HVLACRSRPPWSPASPEFKRSLRRRNNDALNLTEELGHALNMALAFNSIDAHRTCVRSDVRRTAKDPSVSLKSVARTQLKVVVQPEDTPIVRH
ncbi:hypothetical protein WDZ92_46220, partial [Nostoc sp. NIES-2111]